MTSDDVTRTGIRTSAYADGTLLDSDFAMSDVGAFLEREDVVVWVDLIAPTVDQMVSLGEELGIHELAVEDVLEPHQRPKLDHYATHMFLACHHVTLNADTAILDVSELDVLIGERWLVTVRESARFPMDRVAAKWHHRLPLGRDGVAHLIYGLLDLVIDGYMDVVDAFDDFYDEVSEGIFAERPIDPADQRYWFMMGRALMRFHRIVPAVREVVNGLMRRDDDLISDHVRPYFQDLYDHILRVGESTESLRDLMSAIVDTNLSLRDYRQNQVMKKVTSWAAIIAVPTLITGMYGMNVPFPGEGSVWGVVASLSLIVVLSIALFIGFRSRDWL